MVQFTRILAALALVAVSVTVEAAQQPASFGSLVQHEMRLLEAEAGSSAGSKAAGGSTAVGDIPAANQPILAQWTAAKAVLQKAFAGEATLTAKLTAFEAKVTEALKTTITLDAAKKIIGDFLTSLESDPSYKKVETQLASIKAVLGGGAATTSGSSAGSKAAGGSAAPTVGSTSKNSTSSASNSSTSTPAPTTSAATTLVSVVAPAAIAIAAVFASM